MKYVLLGLIAYAGVLFYGSKTKKFEPFFWQSSSVSAGGSGSTDSGVDLGFPNTSGFGPYSSVATGGGLAGAQPGAIGAYAGGW